MFDVCYESGKLPHLLESTDAFYREAGKEWKCMAKG